MQDIIKDVLLIHKNKLIWLIFAVIGISTLQIPAIFVGPDLDASGLIAVSWIRMNNLQIGHDIVSQFGPLSYLLAPVFVKSNLWLQSLLEALLVHFLLIFSMATLVVKLRVNWRNILLVVLLFITFANITTKNVLIDEEVPFSASIFLYLIITNKISNRFQVPLLSFLGLILAVVSLINIDITILSTFVIITYSLISVTKKEFRKPAVFCLSFVLCMLVLWVASDQNLVNFPSFFIDGLKISSGYNVAMALDGPAYQIYAMLIAISFLTFLLSYSIYKKYNNLTIFILLNAFLLFAAYKHGFVRQDAHVLFAYFVFGLFLISTYVVFKYDVPQATRDGKRVFLLSIIILGTVLFIVGSDVENPSLILPDVSANIPPWSEVPSLIFDKSYETQRVQNHIEYLRSHLPLDNETVHNIGNRTMDIFPYDIMIPWLYNFNWDPRPMPWSFQVFNTFLDELNANHFESKKAPQKILYSYKSIDGRYPLFDEPLTVATILRNYQFTQASQNYIILTHNPKNWGMPEDLGTVDAQIGKPIDIPKFDKGYVFAYIDMRFNIVGKVLDILYKPSQTHIRFKLSDSSYSDEFRLIPGTAEDGVFVSQYIDSTGDFASIMAGNLTQNIDQLIISADHPSQFEKNIHVKFVGFPVPILLQKAEKSTIPDWKSLKLVQGGSANFDQLGYKLFSQLGNPIYIDANAERLIDIRGWAVDSMSRDGAVKAFLVLGNDGNETTLPTHKVSRPDVAKFFGVKSYQDSGWETAIDTSQFAHKCYSLSLRIPRLNGKEYFDISSGKSICFS